MSSENKVKIAGNYMYCTSDVLGIGTWGTVYKGKSKDLDDDRQYAIKKINKFKIEASQKSYQKYQSEVITLHQAKNIPQIIQIIDFFKSKSNYYIVTNYLAGSCDLFQYMQKNKRKFCQAEARPIWYDLLRGINELHKLKIYHRDLKLQNILYVPNKCAKIIDFGVANYYSNPQGFVGSPLFMSPQVLNGQKYSYKCDIWSLGVIFYCMVCRVSPYGDTMNTKVIQQKQKKMRKEQLQYPKEAILTQQCKKVIQGCLKYQQKDRMEISDILKLSFFLIREINQEVVQKTYIPKTTFRV